MLRPPSTEQYLVVESFKTNNVIVQAVAGAGKTTTIIHTARAYPQRRMLLLTYNARLKEETRSRVRELDLHNLEVHSYHAFAVKYLHPKCFTDRGIMNALHDASRFSKSLPSYDVLIIDEAQDMTPLYYELVQVIMHALPNPPQCMVLGDSRQSIFGFNHADARFLQYANRLFQNPYEWSRHKLSTTYRCSRPICQFVNMCLGDTAMIPYHDYGKPVMYMSINPYSMMAADTILQLLEVYGPDELFVLAPSVRSSKTPIRTMVNTIKLRKPEIQVFVPTHDDETIDTDVISGKLVFTTFHQVKGLERNAVVLFNFDASYYEYYKKGMVPTECANEVYVAMTRAKQKLVVIQDHKKAPHGFVQMGHVFQHCEFVGMPVPSKSSEFSPNASKAFEVAVTDITRHMSARVMHKALSFVRLQMIQPAASKIHIPTKIQQDRTFESVSEITGTAIAAHVEYLQTGSMTIDDTLRILPQHAAMPAIDSLDHVGNLLQKATLYCASVSGYMHKPMQITRYDWMTGTHLDAATQRMQTVLGDKECTFEEPVHFSWKDCTIIGRVDCICSNTGDVYEFKCVHSLKDEHIIQLAFYAYMLLSKRHHPSPYRFWLYNLLTDELVEVCGDLEAFEKLVHFILDVRNGIHLQSDEEFFAMCEEIACSKRQ